MGSFPIDLRRIFLKDKMELLGGEIGDSSLRSLHQDCEVDDTPHDAIMQPAMNKNQTMTKIEL